MGRAFEEASFNNMSFEMDLQARRLRPACEQVAAL